MFIRIFFGLDTRLSLRISSKKMTPRVSHLTETFSPRTPLYSRLGFGQLFMFWGPRLTQWRGSGPSTSLQPDIRVYWAAGFTCASRAALARSHTAHPLKPTTLRFYRPVTFFRLHDTHDIRVGITGDASSDWVDGIPLTVNNTLP